MKRIFFLLGLLSVLLLARAQGAPPEHTPYFTLVYAETGGHLQFSANNTVIWVESPAGTFEKIDQTMYDQTTVSYTNNQLDSKTVKIYGMIKDFDCDYSTFSSIDISHNNQLTKLHSSSCSKLTTVHLEQATALEQLTVRNCLLLRNLDISGAPALKKLDCSKNELGSLDVSNHPSLTELYCHTALISHLNLENATALEMVFCYVNPFEILDTSTLKKLRVLYCNKTNIESLDLSQNPALTFLNCSSGFRYIKHLNVANGNNHNFKRYKTSVTYAFSSAGNRISYIKIDEGFTPPIEGNDRWIKDNSSKWQETPFSGLNSQEKEKACIYAMEGCIHVENITPNTTVKVYNLTGKLVGTYWVTGDEVDLPMLPNFYLVQIGTESTKVVVL
jgi:hypothetical protein